MTSELANISAESLMERLQAEANRAGDPRRIGTLSRLVEACDELLSGGAYRAAKAAKLNPEIFNPNFLPLNSKIVAAYVKFRRGQEGSTSPWTGPAASTIRGEAALMDYLGLREAEANRPGKPKAAGPRTRKLDELIDGVSSISDQALLRQALADGRMWKRELDILKGALRKLPEIDIDALLENKPMLSRPRTQLPSAGLAPEEIQVIAQLVNRFRDNATLDLFDLKYEYGRVKMSMSPGYDLVLPEELRLLERLSGMGSEPA